MNDYEYEKFVASRCKPGAEINTSPRAAHIQHMLLGLMGEVGELTDALKKHLIYDQPLDMENVDEELGDCEFYLAGLRNVLSEMGGSSRQQILKNNKGKLTVRFPEGYTNEHAEKRIDKVVDTLSENP